MMKRDNSATLPNITLKNSSSIRYNANGAKAVQKAQDNLKTFVDELNDHIKWLLNRKQYLLQGRHYQVLQQLNETKKALAVYEKGIKNLKKQIEDDPKIRTMKKQIEIYDGYSEILTKLFSGTDKEIQAEKQKIDERKNELAEKRKSLNAKNHDNIQLASQITKLRDILDGVKARSQDKVLPIEFSKDPSQNVFTTSKELNVNIDVSKDLKGRGKDRDGEEVAESEQAAGSRSITNSESMDKFGETTFDEYVTLRRRTETLIRKNHALKKNVVLKFTNFNELYELFLQSFHKYEGMLYKSQMVVHNQGLNGSLIFLLLNSKKRTLDTLDPVTMKDTKLLAKRNNIVKPFQKQQEGEVIDVVYSTFKRMLQQEEKKNDKVKEMVSSVQYDQLLTFTPMQVMGLVLLKPEVLRDIIFEFDDKKKRLRSVYLSLKNIKITESK